MTKRLADLPFFLGMILCLGFTKGTAAQNNAPTITVQTGARQAFAGLGVSIFPWTPAAVYNAQVTPAETRKMARLLWHDARLRSARLWIHPGEEPVSFYVDGYVRTHKLPEAIAAGATDLILAPDPMPPSMNDGHGFVRNNAIPQYAALLAGFIADFKAKTGILINYCGVLNEPNDRPVKPSDAQWPVLIKALRAALDARGLRTVGIVAPEAANCGADAYAVVDSIHADPVAWNDSLDGEMTYTYGKKPHLNAAVARNPDGTWAIGLSNFTAPAFQDADNSGNFPLYNSGYHAQSYAVMVRVPELAQAKRLRFAVYRSSSSLGEVPEGYVIMHSGVVALPSVEPLDLVTLRSRK